MSTETIYNAIVVNEAITTGGQPTETQLRAAAAEGFANVINLAPVDRGNALADEAGLVRSLGMQYYAIPVEWEAPQESDFEAFDALMRQLPKGKTLIHCAANFRVTAFYALYAQKRLGWSEQQAEAFRARIWAGSAYPVWEAFIAHIRAGLPPQARPPG